MPDRPRGDVAPFPRVDLVLHSRFPDLVEEHVAEPLEPGAQVTRVARAVSLEVSRRLLAHRTANRPRLVFTLFVELGACACAPRLNQTEFGAVGEPLLALHAADFHRRSQPPRVAIDAFSNPRASFRHQCVRPERLRRNEAINFTRCGFVKTSACRMSMMVQKACRTSSSGSRFVSPAPRIGITRAAMRGPRGKGSNVVKRAKRNPTSKGPLTAIANFVIRLFFLTCRSRCPEIR